MAYRLATSLLAAALALPLLKADDVPADEAGKPASLARPIALALVDGERAVLVAQRDRGSLALLDARSLKVVAETRTGNRLIDMAVDARGGRVAVIDDESGELALFQVAGRSLRELRRLKVGVSPVSVRLSEDGGLAAVGLLWPRQLALVDLNAKEAKVRLVDLPFAPRRQVLAPDGERLFVADAFGASLAVVNLATFRVERVHRIASVHNIRGLALDQSGKRLLLAHQTLHATGHPTRGEIQSGNLVTNELRRLPLSDLLHASSDPLRNDRVHPLGDIDRGAGDPADVVETAAGKVVVAFAGVGEVAVGEPDRATWTRLAVGERPVALAVDKAGERAYVANMFADSISVIDLQAQEVVAETPLSPLTEAMSAARKKGMDPPDLLGPRDRGEVLFHDARLSFDGWYSCHSCHSDGHTSGRLNDNLTDGSFGTPKRVLTLLGVKDTLPLAWDGKMPDLAAQVRNSLTSTMQGPKPPPRRVGDLVAYLESLTPPPAVLAARGLEDRASVERGRQVFAEHKCASCHKEPHYTSPRTYDVGLRDEAGLTHFNPPSLRGVSQGGPYFHDGRAATLAEIFTRHRHQLNADVSPRELEDLLRFLNSL